MSLLFALIFLGTPVLTLLWCVAMDRRVRQAYASLRRDGREDARSRMRFRWCWARVTLSAFGVVFFLGFTWLLLGRMWPEGLVAMGLPRVPAPWLMSFLMLWAIIVLPLVVIPSMALEGAWRLGAAAWRMTQQAFRPAEAQAAGSLTAQAIAGEERPTLSDSQVTRRQVLTGVLATAPVWTTVGLTGWGAVQKRRFRIRELKVEVPGLPAALDGVTIAHVSDTHVGKFTHGEVLNRIADAANDLAADLVLLTGDVIDHSIHELPEAGRMIDRMDRGSGLFLS